MMDNGWGDDDEILSDDFEDIIDNEGAIDENNSWDFPPEKELPFIADNSEKEALLFHIDNNDNSAEIVAKATSHSIVNDGWGEDDINLADDEDANGDDVSGSTPVLRQLQHHIWPLSVPIDMEPASHTEKCPMVNLEQALEDEEKTNQDDDKGWSFDESAAESSSWVPDEEPEENKQFDAIATQEEAIIVAKHDPDSSQLDGDEFFFTEKEVIQPQERCMKLDEVLSQLQHHVPPMTVPAQLIRTCSVDVEIELAHEEQQQVDDDIQEELKEPATDTAEPILSQQEHDITVPVSTSSMGPLSTTVNSETAWCLEDDFDVGDDKENFLMKLDTVDIMSSAPTPTLDTPQLNESATEGTEYYFSTPLLEKNKAMSSNADTNGKNNSFESKIYNDNISNQNEHVEDNLVDYPRLLETEMTKNIILNKHIDTLQRTIDELQSLQEHTEAIAQQKEDKAVMDSMDMTAQVQYLQESLQALQEKKTQEERRMEHVMSQFTETRIQLEKMRETMSGMEDKFHCEKQQLEREICGLRTSLDHHLEEAQCLRQQITDTTKLNRNLESHCALLKNEKEEILYQLQVEQKSLASERENAAFLTSSLAELRQQEQAQIASEQHLKRKHQEQVDSLLNDLKNLEGQIEAFEAQSEELTMLRRESASLRQYHEKEKRELLHQLQTEQSNTAFEKENVARLTCKLEDANQKLQVSSQRTETQMQDRAMIENLEKQHRSEIQVLLNKSQGLEKQAAFVLEQNEKLECDLTMARQEINEIVDMKDAALLQVSDLLHQLHNVQQYGNNMEQKYLTMKGEKDEICEEYNRIINERARLERKCDDLNTIIQEKEIIMKQQADSIRGLEEQVVSSNRMLEKTQSLLDTLSDEKNQIASENEELLIQLGFEGQRLQKLEAEFVNLNVYFEEQLNAVAAEKEDIKRQQEALLRENANLMEEVEALSNQMRMQQERLKDNTAAITEADTPKICEAESSAVALAELQKKFNEACLKLDFLDKVCEGKTEEIAALNQSIQDRMLELSANEKGLAKLDDIEKNYGEKITELGELKLELSNVKEKNEILSVELDQTRADVSGYISKLDQCRSELVCCQNSLSKYQDRCSLFDAERAKLLDQLAAQDILLKGMQNMDILTELPQESAEAVDFMREKIIALASALEKSEQSRATAIDRISAERRDHAESLRKVSENVKRLYATWTRGQANP